MTQSLKRSELGAQKFYLESAKHYHCKITSIGFDCAKINNKSLKHLHYIIYTTFYDVPIKKSVLLAVPETPSTII